MGPAVHDSVSDHVVNGLTEARRIDLDCRGGRGSAQLDPNSAKPRSCDDVLHEHDRVDGVEVDRHDGGVGHDSLDPTTRQDHQAHELATGHAIELAVHNGLGDRRERGDRAAHLVHEHGEPLGVEMRGHAPRSASRSRAHAAVSATIASSDAA